MPWEKGTFDAVCAGLRCAAVEGNLMPLEWNGGIQSNNNGGYAIYGCGWGQVGWLVAIVHGGVQYARDMLPPGAGQTEVNMILKAAGLTRAEIKSMDPQAVWMDFDCEIEDVYANRANDPEAFVVVSKAMAEFFIEVLSAVPVVKEVPSQASPSREGRAMDVLSKLLTSWSVKHPELETA